MRHIKTLNQFMEWVDFINPDSEPEKYLFRGLKDEQHKIEASAWRRLPAGPDVSGLEPFLEINKSLIKEARLLGHDYRNGRELYDLEILAELQHFRAATCLIDFTYSAQVALWFACQQDSNLSPCPNGKVTAVLNDPETVAEVTLEMVKEEDLDSFFTQDDIDIWGPVLYRWQPKHLNNRISSQHSVFLFGSKQVIPNEACIIVASCKEKILNSLEKHPNITERTLFPDFEGFAGQHGHDKTYRFPDYAKLADQAWQRNQYSEAILNYNKAIELNSKDALLYYRRARVRYSIVDHSRSSSLSLLNYLNEAEKDLQKARSLADQVDNREIIDKIQRLQFRIQQKSAVIRSINSPKQ